MRIYSPQRKKCRVFIENFFFSLSQMNFEISINLSRREKKPELKVLKSFILRHLVSVALRASSAVFNQLKLANRTGASIANTLKLIER